MTTIDTIEIERTDGLIFYIRKGERHTLSFDSILKLIQKARADADKEWLRRLRLTDLSEFDIQIILKELHTKEAKK